MVVGWERVDRLMVDEPTTITSLVARPVDTTDVAIREVTTEPAEFVVVTSILVGMVVVSGAASEVGDWAVVPPGVGEGSSADVGVSCSLVGCEVGDACEVVSGALVGSVEVGAALLMVVAVVVSSAAELVVTPVPTICLLSFGAIPSGISSAAI